MSFLTMYFARKSKDHFHSSDQWRKDRCSFVEFLRHFLSRVVSGTLSPMIFIAFPGEEFKIGRVPLKKLDFENGVHLRSEILIKGRTEEVYASTSFGICGCLLTFRDLNHGCLARDFAKVIDFINDFDSSSMIREMMSDDVERKSSTGLQVNKKTQGQQN